MPQFTPELNISIGIIVFSLLIECYLIIRLLNRYFTSGYPKTLLPLIFSLVTSLISDNLDLFGIFFNQTEIEYFINVQRFAAIGFILAVYLLLLFSEVFEYDTIFTRQQMIATIILTVTVIVILGGEFQPLWLEDERMFLKTIDSLSNILIMVFTGFIGILMMFNLRKGLQDSWIVQRKQLILMIVGISIGILFPLVYRTILFAFNYSSEFLLIYILDSFIIITFIVFFLSFGSSDLISLFNRRKADKIVVTSQNGIPLFMYDFKIDVHRIDATLFSGAIVAITMLMTESIRSPAPIAEVLMKNKYRLILESKSSFIALIFTPEGSSTIYLRESLEKFSTMFDQKFGSFLASGEVVDLDLFAESGVAILFQSFRMPIDTSYIKTVID
ncbi:MAG: hypothetical protein ACFE95_08400 [Candidatus Hodarchaeota archaeon]